MMSIQL